MAAISSGWVNGAKWSRCGTWRNVAFGSRRAISSPIAAGPASSAAPITSNTGVAISGNRSHTPLFLPFRNVCASSSGSHRSVTPSADGAKPCST